MEQITLTTWKLSLVTPTEAKYFVDLVVEGRAPDLSRCHSSYFHCILFYRKAIPTRLLKSPLKAYRYIHKRLDE